MYVCVCVCKSRLGNNMTGLNRSMTPDRGINKVGGENCENNSEMEDLPDAVSTQKMKMTWYKREDLQAWFGSLIFLGAILAMIFVVGNARGWDALSGYTHNTSLTSAERFLPEPFREEEGVRGRYGPGATGRWYYWKLPPIDVSAGSRVFCWVSYALHQVLLWAVIYYAQVVKAKEPLGNGRYSQQLSYFNWIALGLNVFFHLIHFINTHATYDGLAQDVSVATSQSSVIMLLVLILILEYKERGLAFGWPTPEHKQTCSTKIRLNYGPVNLVRRYHGYAFAWAACYTFWYHPMENTWGHALGFVHTYIILLQGGLMYTDLHLNKYWRLTQEVWVTLHGGIVAWQTGGPRLNGTGLWPMFVFGFLLCFALTQIFSLPMWRYIPRWCRVLPILIYFAITVACYSRIPNAEGRYFVRMDEIIRIPAVYYLYFLFGWALLLGFLAIEKCCSKNNEAVTVKNELSPLKQTLWLSGIILVYAIHVGLSVAIEYGDWKMDLIVLMIIFVGIFLIGANVSFMFLKQVVPLRVYQESENADKKAEMIGAEVYQNGGNANAKVLGEAAANEAFNSDL